MWVQVGLGEGLLVGRFFVYTFLQLPFDRRPGFALQERCIANDTAGCEVKPSLPGEDALIGCE